MLLFYQKGGNKMPDKINPESDNSKEELPKCPQCKSNKNVGKISSNTHVMVKLFILKPLDSYYCANCKIGF